MRELADHVQSVVVSAAVECAACIFPKKHVLEIIEHGLFWLVSDFHFLKWDEILQHVKDERMPSHAIWALSKM